MTEEKKKSTMKTLQLTLEYDDRYTLKNLKDGYFIYSVEDEDITSHQVEGGKASINYDDAVIRIKEGSDTEFTAAAVGKAVMLIAPRAQRAKAANDMARADWYRVEVTVNPAPLTLMFLCGQGTAEGYSSDITGYEICESAECIPGTVYSTYAPTNKNMGEKITGCTFEAPCTAQNAADFAAGSLVSDISLSGRPLSYPLNSLTAEGRGKAGMDGALAYEWNRLLKEKVWIVNLSAPGQTTANCQKGTAEYERIKAAALCVIKTYKAEAEAGHITAGRRLFFWMQGENERNVSAKEYANMLISMCKSLKKELRIEAFGLILPRSNKGNPATEDDIEMTGPRTAQYLLGQNPGYPYIYAVSNDHEKWVTDEGVKEYFAGAYPRGFINLPRHAGGIRYISTLPQKVDEIHGDYSFSQTAHNETGLSAARGMYNALYGCGEEITAAWRGENGCKITSLTIGVGESAALVSSAEPVYLGKKVVYKFSNRNVSFDAGIYTVTGVAKGKTCIKAYVDGKQAATMQITIVEESVNGLARDENGQWAYYTHSAVDKAFCGVAQNDEGWFFVRNGRIDLTYTGIARNKYGWWYVKDGKLDRTYTGFADYALRTWYVEKGQITFRYSGFVEKDGAQYLVLGSSLDKTSKSRAFGGKWYLLDKGRVMREFTGLTETPGGMKFVNKGVFDFSYTGTYKGADGIYCMADGRPVNDSGITKCGSKWYMLDNGKVMSDYFGFAENRHGKWYVLWGEIDFTCTGTVMIDGIVYKVHKGKVVSEAAY